MPLRTHPTARDSGLEPLGDPDEEADGGESESPDRYIGGLDRQSSP
jgi:hypothetical protein